MMHFFGLIVIRQSMNIMDEGICRLGNVPNQKLRWTCQTVVFNYLCNADTISEHWNNLEGEVVQVRQPDQDRAREILFK